MGVILSVEDLTLTLGLLLVGAFTVAFGSYIYFDYTNKVRCKGYGKSDHDTKSCEKQVRNSKWAMLALLIIGALMFVGAVLFIAVRYIRTSSLL